MMFEMMNCARRGLGPTLLLALLLWCGAADVAHAQNLTHALDDAPVVKDVSQLEEPALRALLIRAREKREAGALDEAHRLYDAILATEKGEPWLMLEVGEMLNRGGMFGMALPYFESARRLAAMDIDVLVGLAVSQDGLGQNLAAIKSLERALLMNPDHAQARFNLGILQYVIGELELAEATYRDLIARHKGHWKAYNNLGMVLLERGEPTGAMAPLRRALKIKKDDPGVLYNLGRAYAARGEHTRAIAFYDRALLQWGPDDLAAVVLHFSRGNALFALRRYTDALAAYTKATELDPEYWDAHLNRGAALANLGRYDDAVEALKIAVEYKSNKSGIYRQIAICHIEDRNFEQALAILEQATALDADNGELYALKARALASSGQKEQATVATKRACALGLERACR